MTISATHGVHPSTDHGSSRETRVDDDHASDFAGMFAGAVHSTTHKPELKRDRDGTSELDKPEETAADGDDKKTKRARPRHVAETSDTPAVVQTTAALDPELQAKLARVIARMRAETGQDVTVTETYRSQDRQNALFAQGRETPGSVVTWTQNSKHTQGRAVDVLLDAGAAGFDAYATLQRIAGEEGLRTLGARDPGHLELPGTGQPLHADANGANDATLLTSVEPAGAASPGGVSIARLAQLAQVAQVTVARPAEVARVASVARPGAPGVGATGAHTTTGPSASSVLAAPDNAGNSTQRPTADSTEQGDGESSGGSGGNAKGEHRGGYGALAAAVALRDASPHVSSPVNGVGVMSGAERAAQIIAAYQDAPARPLSQLTMSVDAGNGVTDKVQVSLRGSSLNAAIDTGDARGAQAMTQRADELVRALSRDGIEVESLRVRAAAATAVTGSPASHSSSDASSHSKFERNNPWQQQDRQRPQDDRRQQQQRNQRGGRDQ